MTDIGLIIFDCDGVLVDSEPIANAILRDALRDLGVDMTLEDVMRTYVGHSMGSVVADLETRLGYRLPADWLDHLQVRTFDALRARLRPFPGVRAAVSTIRASGIGVCVASSGAPDKIALSLELTELAPLFQGAVFSAIEVPRGKPAPDLFLHAAGAMGAPPAACVVVEDSSPGITAARAAGMRCVAHRPADPGEAARLGIPCIDDMAALPALLGLVPDPLALAD